MFLWFLNASFKWYVITNQLALRAIVLECSNCVYVHEYTAAVDMFHSTTKAFMHAWKVLSNYARYYMELNHNIQFDATKSTQALLHVKLPVLTLFNNCYSRIKQVFW